MPGLSATIASKQGIIGFTQSACPGIGKHQLKGDLLQPWFGGHTREMTEAQFMQNSLHAAYKGMMPAVHTAAAAVYLTSEHGSEFNGTIVNVIKY